MESSQRSWRHLPSLVGKELNQTNFQLQNNVEYCSEYVSHSSTIDSSTGKEGSCGSSKVSQIDKHVEYEELVRLQLKTRVEMIGQN